MRRSVFLAAVCAAFVPTVAAASTLPTQPQHPQTVVSQPTSLASPSAASAAPQRKAAPAPTTRAPQPPPASTRPAAPPAITKAPPPAVRTVYLAPVTAYLSQALIDQGKLVLWRAQPWLIAGHDNMGWSWLDDIAVGTIVVVTVGPAAGRYRVVGHRWSATKGGPVVPAWITDWPDDGLILQTCTGASGTGFTLAMRA